MLELLDDLWVGQVFLVMDEQVGGSPRWLRGSFEMELPEPIPRSRSFGIEARRASINETVRGGPSDVRRRSAMPGGSHHDIAGYRAVSGRFGAGSASGRVKSESRRAPSPSG